MMIMKNGAAFILCIMLGMGIFATSILAIGLSHSIPKVNQVLKAGNQTIQLKYDHQFDPFRSRLLLTGPENKLILIPATTNLNHDEVKTQYMLAPGKYNLHWEIWTWDNKKNEGNIPFSVIP